jgi:hypothetical protein
MAKEKLFRRFRRTKKGTEDKSEARRFPVEPITFRLIASRRGANLELGRLFIQIKATLKHGRRQPHSLLKKSPAEGGKNDEQNKQKSEFEAPDEQDTLR